MRVHVVRKPLVAQSLARLRKQKTHTLFTGYLYLQQQAAMLDRLEDLPHEFLQFFNRFFLVPNHPLGTPYIKPFTEKAGHKSLWLNENVAGSYAPSSLRPDQPFRRVVDIKDKKYSLRHGHAKLAFRHLLYSRRVQVADLAVVLYRDFGLLGNAPTIKDLIDIFAYEFGYAVAPGAPTNDHFRVLFSLESANHWDENWLDSTELTQDDFNGLTGRGDRESPTRTHIRVRNMAAVDILSLKEKPSDGELPLQEMVIDGLLSFCEKTRFEFGRLNILVGPNGSGKSNLIDCLRVLRAAPGDIQEAFMKSGFEEWLYNGRDKQSGRAFLEVVATVPVLRNAIRHQLYLGPPLKLRAPLEEKIYSLDPESSEEYLYFVGSHLSQATLVASSSGKRSRERTLGEKEYDPLQSILSQIRDIGQYPEITHLASFYSNFRIYSEWTFGRKSNLRNATPAGRSETRLSESMDDLALALNGLELTAAHDKIRGLLRQLKETYRDFVTRILFGHVGLELVEAPFEKLPLPANRLSDGTLRFLALAVILLQPDLPPLICLEEPELGMHPDMIRMVAGMIADAAGRTQLIVTTHSELLLSALQDDFDALFAFDAGVNGSVVRRFGREEYEEWRQEHTLGELWSSGELGGNRW